MNSAAHESAMDGFDLFPIATDAGSGSASELRAGDLCPSCRSGHLDYDGLLNLVCPRCGYGLGGCFT
jgi:hypothetical protein